MQNSQRLINIKIANAYRTISYEASCLLACVQPIGIEIEKSCLYKRKHSTGKEDYEWDNLCLQRGGLVLLCEQT